MLGDLSKFVFVSQAALPHQKRIDLMPLLRIFSAVLTERELLTRILFKGTVAKKYGVLLPTRIRDRTQ